jgi:cobalt-zinc-cadmium efflux system protein
MKLVEGVRAIHDLHVWSITNDMRSLSCHVFISDGSQDASACTLRELRALLSKKYQIHHATLQLECETHTGGCTLNDSLYCRMDKNTHDHHMHDDHNHDHHDDHGDHNHDHHNYDEAPTVREVPFRI